MRRPAVFAHAYLVKSIPAQRAVLLRAPAKIQLWFNERLEPRYSSLTLSDEAGNKVEVVKTEVGPEDPKQIIATLKPLAAGRYKSVSRPFPSMAMLSKTSSRLLSSND